MWGGIAAALCLTAMLVGPAAFAASASELSAAVNQAGRQRMLSQRIVKAYCQLGLDVDTPAARAQLAEALGQFGAGLSALAGAAEAAHAGEPLARMQEAWRPFRRIAATTPSQQGAGELDVLGERLLAAAGALTLRLEQQSDRSGSQLVNVAGRQRMLSQRLAKLHLLRAWGIDSPALREQASAAREEFYGAMMLLEKASEKTPEIAHELQAAAMQWEWLRNALSREGPRAYALGVAQASERLLERMERITALYTRLPR